MKWIAPHGAATSTERYRNAEPTIAGSNPDAAFFNTVLDELLAVIVAADMTPTDENLHQIADAIEYLTERAATSGVTKGSYWFGKTTANFTVPNPTLPEQNYIDFTTLNTYSAKSDLSGWTQTGTFVPPVGIDFTILITSKFWDIPEQDGQQGGWAQYNHTDDEWSWWPKIINLDNVANLSLSNLNDTGKNRFQKNLVSSELALMPFFTVAIQNSNLGNHTWRSVVYDGTKFVAISSTGYISTSTDGENWTNATENSNLGNRNWSSVVYDGTKFVAISFTGYISTSTDGTTWAAATQNTNLGNHTWYSIAYNGTKFVAISSTGYISTSTDGENWTNATQNSNLGDNLWYSIVYDGTKFVALGSRSHISTSTDGTTWAAATQNTNLYFIGNDGWNKIIYNGTKFIAIGSYGWVSVSNDGINWAIPVKDTHLSNTTTHCIAYDGTKFVVLSGNGYLSISSETSEIITADCVVEFQKPTSTNNYTWYRKYKSGWIEQGGKVSSAQFVTLPKAMPDTNYNVIATCHGTNTTVAIGINVSNTTGFYINCGTYAADWYVCGMAA